MASLLFAERTGSVGHQLIGLALVALLCIVITGLTFRTVRAILRQEICLPE